MPKNIALVLAGLLSVLPVAARAETPHRGGTAILVLPQEPPVVNPNVTQGLPDKIIGCIFYEGMVSITPEGEVIPRLAKSWTITPDGKTYSFELGKAEFHDGKPVTSEDVKYTLLEVSAKYSPSFTAAGRDIDHIDTPAADKVVISLKEPFGPFLQSLACEQGAAVMPSHLFRGTNPLQNPATTQAPVGTGPFKFVEWKRGDHIRLVKYDKYHREGRPYLNGLIAKIITDSGARMQALAAGEVDIVPEFEPSNRAMVAANPKLQVVQSDVAPLFNSIFMNITRKPLDDKRVRKALFMATDRDYLVKNAFSGVGNVGTMPFTKDIAWAANPDIDYSKMYPYDPVKAGAALDEAGFKRGVDGKRMTLHLAIFSNEHQEFLPVSVALKSMWQAAGIETVIDAMESGTLVKKVYVDRDFDTFLMSYTSLGDPALGIQRAFISGTLNKPYGNPTGYSNPTVDALFQKGEHATDVQERGKYYREAQTILAEDLPSLTIRDYRAIDGATKRLHDLWGKVQSGSEDWAEAWLEP